MQPLIAERLRDNALSVEVQIARATARTTSGRKKGVVMDNDDGGDGDAGVGGGEHPDDGDIIILPEKIPTNLLQWNVH